MKIFYVAMVLGTLSIIGCGEYKTEQPAESTEDASQQQGSDSKDKPAEGSGY